ncbi:MAG: manganese efflux pump, partial [Parasporobacterium sp.]|nr:manganese efflux pump [Parasporobacterium sp.]
MILDGRKEEESGKAGKLKPPELILQGIATSIDALSVGFTIAEYSAMAAFTASVIIAAVTFAICVGGLYIGRRFGTKISGKASILGGCILIGIGLEIFLTGIF